MKFKLTVCAVRVLYGPTDIEDKLLLRLSLLDMQVERCTLRIDKDLAENGLLRADLEGDLFRWLEVLKAVRVDQGPFK
jgi:hypothetical protein